MKDKAQDKAFTPAEGVTLQNALRYVAAVGQAIRRDLLQLPLEDRGFIAGLLGGALHLEAQEIDNYRKGLIQAGEALPMTAQQQEQFKWMMHRIFDRKPGS
jgi:hypothetical protein